MIITTEDHIDRIKESRHWKNPPFSASEIAIYLDICPARAGQILNQMASEGILRRYERGNKNSVTYSPSQAAWFKSKWGRTISNKELGLVSRQFGVPV